MKTAHWIFVGKDTHKFSIAHMTVFPDGTKENLHGHNYHITLSLRLSDISLKNLLPFRELKNALELLCGSWKEKVFLAGENPFLKWNKKTAKEIDFSLCGKRYVFPKDEVIVLGLENIVVETLAYEVAKQLQKNLQVVLKKHKITGLEVNLTETAGQGAKCLLEW